MKFQPFALLFAILSACAIALIGVFVAEKNIIGIISCIIAIIIIMGVGFMTKKRWRV